MVTLVATSYTRSATEALSLFRRLVVTRYPNAIRRSLNHWDGITEVGSQTTSDAGVS